jgi:monothiol glutaredoxin
MSRRKVLDDARIHAAIREKIAGSHSDILQEVEEAVGGNDVVVVGMKQNPLVRQARKTLAQQAIPYAYLEYGSYLSEWRRRNALKMWTGWPTFPMIFVRGMFIGGASDLDALVASGEVKRLLAAARPG